MADRRKRKVQPSPTILKEYVDEYVEKDGEFCVNPECKNSNVTCQGSIRYDGPTGLVYQRVQCEDCGWSWEEVLKIVGVQNISDLQNRPVAVEEK